MRAGRTKRRHRAVLAFSIVLVLLACTGVAGTFAYSTVKVQADQLQAQLTAHLQTGQGELEAAKATLTSANANHDVALITRAAEHFTAAKSEFTAARQIADGSKLLSQLEVLPSVGQMATSRHAAVDGIADMGVAISDAGLELSRLEGQLIEPANAGGQQGQSLLAVLEKTKQSLVVVRKDFDRAKQAAARVDFRVVPVAQQATFLKAKATIGSAIAAADEFERLVPILTELLGGNGARTYLVTQVNPAELRPGGGFIGSYSIVRADQGVVKLVRSGDAVELIGNRAARGPGKPGYVLPPGPLREFVPANTWSFIDSNFFPDFPSNAMTAEGFAEPYVGHIDAVISIDYYAVARMLDLTGPLAVPGYALTVTGANFVQLVVQYDLDLGAQPLHKAILGAVAGVLMNRLATLPADGWPALIGALNELAASRHLQVFFNNASAQKEIDRIGWSGTLNPTGARDYMMEVEANLGGTKANYFVTRHFTVELTRNGSTLHHKVTIDIRDDMPFSYRPNEYYSAYLRLYVKDTASLGASNLRKVKYANPPPPAGLRMSDGWVPLFHGYGHSGQAVFEYDSPWEANGRGEGEIYWQKQPGTLDDRVDIKWSDGSGHVFTASGVLAQDRVIALSAKGVSLLPGQPAQAKLPTLSLG